MMVWAVACVKCALNDCERYLWGEGFYRAHRVSRWPTLMRLTFQ